jgi:hypothetical protein
MSNATHLWQEAARANRLAAELDPLTRERLQALAADYIKQASELESSGQIVPSDFDPTE